MKIDKETKRQLRRKRLMDNKVYQVMGVLTRYMDRYYLDACHCAGECDSVRILLPVYHPECTLDISRSG